MRTLSRKNIDRQHLRPPVLALALEGNSVNVKSINIFPTSYNGIGSCSVLGSTVHNFYGENYIRNTKNLGASAPWFLRLWILRENVHRCQCLCKIVITMESLITALLQGQLHLRKGKRRTRWRSYRNSEELETEKEVTNNYFSQYTMMYVHTNTYIRNDTDYSSCVCICYNMYTKLMVFL